MLLTSAISVGSFMKVLILLLTLALTGFLGAWLLLGPYLFSHFAPPMSSDTDISSWEQTAPLSTRLGSVIGLKHSKGLAFLGVPFAKAPTDELRFMPPVPVEPWQEPLLATSFPNRCMQIDLAPIVIEPNSFAMSEDCLFLNIYTPSTQTKNRPVLFWIHGGSFTAGSGNGYIGTQLAKQGDVVLVSINYRLGILGFLDLSSFSEVYTGSASNGIRDQVLALEWVHHNIQNCGGDPNNVTIFGESAGATSVASLLAAPRAAGLFHKAIIHSGAPVIAPPDDFRGFLSEILEVPSDDLLQKLRAMNAAEITALQNNNLPGQLGGIIDGAVVTKSSYQAIRESDIPIIVGSNKNEGSLFSFLTPRFAYGLAGPFIAELFTTAKNTSAYIDSLKTNFPDDSSREQYERIWYDLFRFNAVKVAEHASNTGQGSWLYRFDMAAQNDPIGIEVGASHALEIPFTFNLFAEQDAGYYDSNDSAVRELAENWSNTLMQFARTGNPNGAGLPVWPSYRRDARNTMILDHVPKIIVDLDRKDRKRWQALGR